MYQLEIAKGPQKGKKLTLGAEPLTIGRSRANELVLHDEKVSSQHAVITTSGDKLFLRDLGSTNGTMLNGRSVGEAEIRGGDRLCMGETEIVVRLVEAQPDEMPSVRIVSDTQGNGPTIHETVPSNAENSTVFAVNPEAVDIDSLVAAHRNLQALYKVNSVLSSTFDLPRLFGRILDQLFEVTRAERAVLMLLDEHNVLTPRAGRSRKGGTPEELAISSTIANLALEHGRGILITDALSDERFSEAQSIPRFHIRSAMCVPIGAKEKTIGIIYVDNKLSSGTFSRSDLELLTAFGNEAGVAIENAKLYAANVRAERLAAIGGALAGLSHYIKNVLMCMQGGAQLVQRALDEHNIQGAEKGWGILRRNERKLSGLVMDMLSYCKERGPGFEDCDLADIMQEIIDMSDLLLEDKAVTIERDFEEGGNPIVKADAEAVSRGLLNIFTNAIDAVEPNKGKIRVVVGSNDEEAFVTIKDNGCGISKDVMPRIFEAFFSTKAAKGTGLGLAVVQKTVHEHGGSIKVDSAPGAGSTFTVCLPRMPKRIAERSTDQTSEGSA